MISDNETIDYGFFLFILKLAHMSAFEIQYEKPTISVDQKNCLVVNILHSVITSGVHNNSTRLRTHDSARGSWVEFYEPT